MKASNSERSSSDKFSKLDYFVLSFSKSLFMEKWRTQHSDKTNFHNNFESLWTYHFQNIRNIKYDTKKDTSNSNFSSN